MKKESTKLKYLIKHLIYIIILGSNFLVIQFVTISNYNYEENNLINALILINILFFWGVLFIIPPLRIFEYCSNRGINFKNLYYSETYKRIFLFFIISYLVVKVFSFLFFKDFYDTFYIKNNYFNLFCISISFLFILIVTFNFDEMGGLPTYELLFITIFFITLIIEPLLSVTLFLSTFILLLFMISKQFIKYKIKETREREMLFFKSNIEKYNYINQNFPKSPYEFTNFGNGLIVIKYRTTTNDNKNTEVKLSKYNYFLHKNWYCNNPEMADYILFINDNTCYETEFLEKIEPKYICKYSIISIKHKNILKSGVFESENKTLLDFNDDLNINQREFLNKL